MKMKQVYTKRLDALEARTGEKVYGLHYTNPQSYHREQWIQDGLVKLSGRDEVMTVAEFEQRYPHGTLIRITHTQDWRGDGAS